MDLYKKHILTQIYSQIEVKSDRWALSNLALEQFYFYNCDVCKTFFAIDKRLNKTSEGISYINSHILYLKNRDWKFMGRNLENVLSCDEVLIKNIIE